MALNKQGQQINPQPQSTAPSTQISTKQMQDWIAANSDASKLDLSKIPNQSNVSDFSPEDQQDYMDSFLKQRGMNSIFNLAEPSKIPSANSALDLTKKALPYAAGAGLTGAGLKLLSDTGANAPELEDAAGGLAKGTINLEKTLAYPEAVISSASQDPRWSQAKSQAQSGDIPGATNTGGQIVGKAALMGQLADTGTAKTLAQTMASAMSGGAEGIGQGVHSVGKLVGDAAGTVGGGLVNGVKDIFSSPDEVQRRQMIEKATGLVSDTTAKQTNSDLQSKAQAVTDAAKAYQTAYANSTTGSMDQAQTTQPTTSPDIASVDTDYKTIRDKYAPAGSDLDKKLKAIPSLADSKTALKQYITSQNQATSTPVDPVITAKQNYDDALKAYQDASNSQPQSGTNLLGSVGSALTGTAGRVVGGLGKAVGDLNPLEAVGNTLNAIAPGMTNNPNSLIGLLKGSLQYSPLNAGGWDTVSQALGLGSTLPGATGTPGGAPAGTSSSPRGWSPFDQVISAAESRQATIGNLALTSPQMAAKYGPMLKDNAENLKNLYSERDSYFENQGGAGLAKRGTPELSDLENAGRESVQLHSAIEQFRQAVRGGNPQEIQQAVQNIEGSEKLMEGIRRLPASDQNEFLSVGQTGDITPWLDKPGGVIVPSKVKGVINGIMDSAINKDKLYGTMLTQQKIDPESTVAKQYNPDWGKWDPDKERKLFGLDVEKGVGQGAGAGSTGTIAEQGVEQAGEQAAITGKLEVLQTIARGGAAGAEAAKEYDAYAAKHGLPSSSELLSKIGLGSNKTPPVVPPVVPPKQKNSSNSNAPSPDDLGKYQRAKDAAAKGGVKAAEFVNQFEAKYGKR